MVSSRKPSLLISKPRATPCGASSNPASASVGALVLCSTISQQTCLLTQGHDAARPPLNRLLEGYSCNSVIARQGNKLLDVTVCVVPKLDRVGKIEWAPVAMQPFENEKKKIVKRGFGRGPNNRNLADMNVG